MTRAQKEQVVEEVLGRYGHRVGRVVVEDNESLARLLSTMRCDGSEAVRTYLSSFLMS
ncbi:MAG: hypothetical protein GX537_10390 [Actinobacteria bacterium]|jgi:hypothetical protein|nr:hypothetical protein [Actinomycetota bacterium]